MEILETADDAVSIRLSAKEVLALANSMNEALNAVEWEFETRLGVSRKDVEELLRRFHDLPTPA